jgi:hypothetical protein
VTSRISAVAHPVVHRAGVGASAPAMQFSSVDLPEPDSPTIAQHLAGPQVETDVAAGERVARRSDLREAATRSSGSMASFMASCP